MKFAERLSRFQPSATLAVNAKALEMKEKGLSVISLAVGEPDFATPAHIGNAAKKAIDDNFSQYTAVEGIMDFRKAVCQYYQRQYGVTAQPSNVIITNGGKQSLFNVFMAMLNPGDEALIPAPYWTSYPDMVLLAGGTPVFVPSPVQRGFRISPEDLEAHRTSRTKMLVLNSPSNPTGVTYTAAELDALLNWALKRDVFVVADEIYDQLVYPPAKPASASAFWERHPENLVILNGLSKAFAMTGWRVGYTLGSAALVSELAKIQGQTTSNICSIAQKAGVEALTASYACVTPMREAFMRRRDMAHAEISSWPRVICPKPEGAFYLFPDVSALFTPEMPNASSLCAMLMEKALVSVMPGEAFGDPRCIRLSYSVADETLMAALKAIRKALFG